MLRRGYSVIALYVKGLVTRVSNFSRSFRFFISKDNDFNMLVEKLRHPPIGVF